MGKLVRYLQGLNQGDIIHPDIADLSTLSRAFIKYSGSWGHARITNSRYNFVYLPWFQGGICYSEVEANQDVLSFPFLGCYLARISRPNGSYYCYHIHKERNYRDQRENWNQHINYLLSKANRHGSLFKPSKEFFSMNSDECDLWGIIASNGDCYSMLVRQRGINRNSPLEFIAIVYQGRYNHQLTIP